MNNDFETAVKAKKRLSVAFQYVQIAQKLDQRRLSVQVRVQAASLNTIIGQYNVRFQRVLYILRTPTSTRTTDQIKFVQKYMEEKFLFISKIKDRLDVDIYEQLIANLQLESFDQLEIIFEHGTVGRKMFFVLEGEVAVLIPTPGADQNSNSLKQASLSPKKIKQTLQTNDIDEIIRILNPDSLYVASKKEGEYFGEIAIEQRVPRTATILSKSNTNLAVLTFEVYQRCLGTQNQKLLEANTSFLKSIPIFKSWHQSSLTQFLHICEEAQFQTTSFIYRPGDLSHFVYLVQSGEVIVERFQRSGNDKTTPKRQSIINLGVLGKGQFFGDYEIETFNEVQVVRKSQARARVDTKLFKIKITSLRDAFRQHHQVGALMELKKSKDHFINSLHTKNKEIEQVQSERKVDIVEISETYFEQMKKKQDIIQQVSQQHKSLPRTKRQNLVVQLREQADLEGAIKSMFVDKFSCVIPFREHPLNKETEVIKRVSRKLKPKSKFIKAKISEENRYFSPSCSVMSILNGNKNMIERRFQTANERHQIKYDHYDIIENKRLSLLKSQKEFNLSQQKSHYPEIDLQKSESFSGSNSIFINKNSIAALKSKKSADSLLSMFNNEKLTKINSTDHLIVINQPTLQSQQSISFSALKSHLNQNGRSTPTDVAYKFQIDKLLKQ